jgi:hypothetical protein
MTAIKPKGWARMRMGYLKNKEIQTMPCNNCGQMIPLKDSEFEQCYFCGCEDAFDVRLEPERQHPRWEWPE